MGKKIIIESRFVDLSPFAKYRLGYLDGYTGLDRRLPHDRDYSSGFDEGKTDDTMGMNSKYDTEGHS